MSVLSVWNRDPFVGLDALVRSALSPVSGWTPGSNPFTPAADIRKDGDDAVIRLELPGLDVNKDVAVEVDGNELVISGERRDERSEHDGDRQLREVRYGSFRRSFELPGHVSAETVTATYDAGVLTVRVPKAYQGARARKIPVGGASASPGAMAVSSGEANRSAA